MIGNQNVPAYSFIPTMAVNNKYNGWISNGNYVTAITSIPSLVSRNFTWEKVGTLDIGIDFSMFSNRFTGTFDCSRCGCSLSEYGRYAYTWLGTEFQLARPDWKGELPSRFQPVRQQVKDCEV